MSSEGSYGRSLVEVALRGEERMGEAGTLRRKLRRIELDLAYCSEKILNLEILLMHVGNKASDYEAPRLEKDTIPIELLDKSFEYDILSGFLVSEVKELEALMTSIQKEAADSRHKITTSADVEVSLEDEEEKLNEVEESLRQSFDQLSEINLQSLKYEKILGFGQSEPAAEFPENGKLFSLDGKWPLQTIEQQKQTLQMLEKSLARELDLEKKLSDSRHNEEEIRMKLHYAEHEIYFLEEAIENILERYFEAENAAEVFMGISKELTGQLQLIQFNLNGFIRRESELRSKIGQSMLRLSEQEEDIAKLKSANSHLVALAQQVNTLKLALKETVNKCRASNSEASTLKDQVKALEEQLKDSSILLQQAKATAEARQEQQDMLKCEIVDMGNAILNLKENIAKTESRAQNAESRCTLLAETNSELSQELSAIKSHGNKKTFSLEEKLKESNVQLDHAKASVEAIEEQQAMLYTAVNDMKNVIDELKEKLSKAEHRAEKAESRCDLLTETNLELNEELVAARDKLEHVEKSLHQADHVRIATAKDIGIKTKVITDLVVKLALERERLQMQIMSLRKENRMLSKKCSKINETGELNDKRGVNECVFKASEEASVELSGTDAKETMASRLPSDSASSPTPGAGSGSEAPIQRSDTSDFFVPPGSNDPGWKYAFLANPSTPGMVTCRLCRKVVTGGINRMKQHLAHIKGNTASCPKVTPEVKKEIMDNMEEIKVKRNEKTMRMKDIQGQVSIKMNQPLLDEERDGKRPRTLAEDEHVENLRQSTIKDTFAKEERARVNSFVAKYFYDNDIAFNVVKSDSFLRMCEAIGQYGRSYKPPTYYELTETLLKEQVKETHDFLQGHRNSWKSSGCSIMTDAWTDRRGRSIMNICVNCELGTSFLKSIDSSADSHTADYIASLVDKSIEEVGPDNVVQVVTDNASANMAAGRILRIKYPQIFWSSCAAHCIDLMLEEIGKESKVKAAITKARTLTVFIYSHAKTLSLMRQFTQKGEIVRPGTTRFATTYLTLQSVMDKKDKLRLMFSSDEWRACKWYKTKKGEMASAIVLSPSFWAQVSLTLKIFSPLVHVLRIVDGDKRPAMGFVYGELQDARKEIMSIFKDVEASYKYFVDAVDSKSKGRLDSPLHLAAYFLNPYFFYRDNDQIQREGLALKGFLDCMDIFYPDLDIQDIITRKELPLYERAEGSFGKPLAVKQRSIIDDDFNPARWWGLHGMETPHLKEMAMKVLKLTASSSGCERNWSTFEAVESIAAEAPVSEKAVPMVPPEDEADVELEPPPVRTIEAGQLNAKHVAVAVFFLVLAVLGMYVYHVE